MKTANEIFLYKRKAGYIPRVAAVHDLCAYGNCSLGVAIPVLSAAGIDVCPVATALFSSHTRYPIFTFHDTTEHLPALLKAWRDIHVEIDAVYSGFLGSAEQVERIKELYRDYPNALRIVDPVMGDAGKIYTTYTPELCEAMGSLCQSADILTPNLTEASLLSGRAYLGQSPPDDEIHELLTALLNTGAKYIILKGIVRGTSIINYIAGQDCETFPVSNDLLPFNLHGTGDLFCSAVSAALIAEKSLVEAVRFAGKLVCHAMQDSTRQPDYELRGVSFELRMAEIAALIKNDMEE